MSKQQRNGKRNRREERIGRECELGYYVIVTDTKATERSYFEGLRDSLNSNLSRKIAIKVVKTKSAKLIEKCKELISYEPQKREGWIVFDRDEVVNFDETIQNAKDQNILVGWSNPCFEVWMHAYYGIMPTFQTSQQCCSKFGELYKKKTNLAYSKSEKSLYSHLISTGDEETAIAIAEKRYNDWRNNGKVAPSEMNSCCTVHQLVKKIRDKTK